MHAIRIGKRIAEFDVGWYEEPCLCDNIELVAEVRRNVPIPIVTGEAIYSKEAFAAALAARAADILNPDICNCGGISAMLDIAAMAQPHAVAIAPHNYNSTLVGAGGDDPVVGDDPELLDCRVLRESLAGLRRDRGEAVDREGQLRRTADNAWPWHRHRCDAAQGAAIPRLAPAKGCGSTGRNSRARTTSQARSTQRTDAGARHARRAGILSQCRYRWPQRHDDRAMRTIYSQSEHAQVGFGVLAKQPSRRTFAARLTRVRYASWFG